MQAEPECFILADAGHRVRITEVGEECSVPDLKGANVVDLPLLDDEQLVGAKQRHILRQAASALFRIGSQRQPGILR
jgi:hypothetical protein